jgi:hypothetical protein
MWSLHIDPASGDDFSGTDVFDSVRSDLYARRKPGPVRDAPPVGFVPLRSSTMETTPLSSATPSATPHVHGPSCGHIGIRHEDHVDYLHEGRLQHLTRSGSIVEHVIPVSQANPSECTPQHRCAGHQANHVHGPSCGHAMVPHGDHIDYLVDGHLHHPHGAHCDRHGDVSVA